MVYYKSIFARIFKSIFLTSAFHLLIALVYFVSFPITQNFLANAASGIDYSSIDNSGFIVLINLFILLTSIGLAMLVSAFLKSNYSTKNKIVIAPLVLEPITIKEPQPQKVEQPKKKIIIQF